MENIATPREAAQPALTAAGLFSAARTRGIPAFAGDPTAGGVVPAKILLASVCDPTDLTVRKQLLDLHRAGEIQLARVDMVGAVPDDRRELLARSAVHHLGAQFDAISVDGWTGGAS